MTKGGAHVRTSHGTSGPFAVATQGIYFFRKTDKKEHDLCFLTAATGKIRKIRTFEHTWLGYLAVSPDGRTVLYTQADQKGTALMLVENFR